MKKYYKFKPVFLFLTLTSVNKPINLYYFYSCIHIFYFFYFSFFIYYFIFWGWAGLDPASPARSLAQANDPAGPKHA